MLCGLLYGVGSSSTSNFLPVMIKRLTQDTVRANLHTIGPNLTGALVMYVSCWVSRPHSATRIGIDCGYCCIDDRMGFAGCIGSRASRQSWIFPDLFADVWHVRANASCPRVGGANTQSASARAVALGFISMCTILGGFVSSGAYRAQDAPTYRPALITVFVCRHGFVVICAGMRVLYARMNQDLARGKGLLLRGLKSRKGSDLCYNHIHLVLISYRYISLDLPMSIV